MFCSKRVFAAWTSSSRCFFERATSDIVFMMRGEDAKAQDARQRGCRHLREELTTVVACNCPLTCCRDERVPHFCPIPGEVGRDRLQSPLGRLNPELLRVVGDQSLPASGFHRLGACQAPDGVAAEKPI